MLRASIFWDEHLRCVFYLFLLSTFYKSVHCLIHKAQELNCDFDTPCKWRNGSNNREDTIDWFASQTSVVLDNWHSIPRAKDGIGDVFLYTRGGSYTGDRSDTAVLISDVIPCQKGNGIITFHFWKTAMLPLLQVCIRKPVGQDGQVLCVDMVSGINPQQWIQRTVEIPGHRSPFEILFKATFDHDFDIIGLDEISYQGSLCDKTQRYKHRNRSKTLRRAHHKSAPQKSENLMLQRSMIITSDGRIPISNHKTHSNNTNSLHKKPMLIVGQQIDRQKLVNSKPKPNLDWVKSHSKALKPAPRRFSFSSFTPSPLLSAMRQLKDIIEITRPLLPPVTLRDQPFFDSRRVRFQEPSVTTTSRPSINITFPKIRIPPSLPKLPDLDTITGLLGAFNGDGSETGTDSGTGVDGNIPGINGNVPGINGNIPGINGNIPGINGNIPGINGNIPGINGNIPGINGNIPGIDGNLPGLNGNIPGINGGNVPGINGNIGGFPGSTGTRIPGTNTGSGTSSGLCPPSDCSFDGGNFCQSSLGPSSSLTLSPGSESRMWKLSDRHVGNSLTGIFQDRSGNGMYAYAGPTSLPTDIFVLTTQQFTISQPGTLTFAYYIAGIEGRLRACRNTLNDCPVEISGEQINVNARQWIPQKVDLDPGTYTIHVIADNLAKNYVIGLDDLLLTDASNNPMTCN